MPWSVIFHEEFDAEFQALEEALQDELLAHAKLLQSYDPDLGRPTVDTLKGSRHANMKELRLHGTNKCGGQRLRLTQGAGPFC